MSQLASSAGLTTGEEQGGRPLRGQHQLVADGAGVAGYLVHEEPFQGGSLLLLVDLGLLAPLQQAGLQLFRDAFCGAQPGSQLVLLGGGSTFRLALLLPRLLTVLHEQNCAARLSGLWFAVARFIPCQWRIHLCARCSPRDTHMGMPQQGCLPVIL